MRSPGEQEAEKEVVEQQQLKENKSGSMAWSGLKSGRAFAAAATGGGDGSQGNYSYNICLHAKWEEEEESVEDETTSCQFVANFTLCISLSLVLYFWFLVNSLYAIYIVLKIYTFIYKKHRRSLYDTLFTTTSYYNHPPTPLLLPSGFPATINNFSGWANNF